MRARRLDGRATHILLARAFPLGRDDGSGE
jgi:hypothetical protein